MLKIFGEEKEDQKPDVYLKLQDDGKRISVVAVDSNGNGRMSGHLLYFEKDTNELHLSWGVNYDLGFVMANNTHGSLKVNE